LPDQNFNKKINNPEKRPEKGQTECLKTEKSQTAFVVLPFLCHKERFLLQEYQNKNFIKITV